MTTQPLKVAFALMIAITAGASIAADDPSADPWLPKGDAAAGESKTAVCMACHGADGNSLNGEWPSLAGQHASYLARQTRLYKSGARENATMLGMSAALSDQDIADISAFYAQQKVSLGAANPDLADLGRALYEGGDAEREIPACMGCHGPSGRGNPGPPYPAVAGQKAQYSALTLRAFREGAVWGTGDDANAVMSEVAANLTDEEISALASYMEGLYTARPAASTAE